MRIIVEIEASDWTKKNMDAFHDWLSNELCMGNMGSGDDARVVSVKKKATKKVTKKKKK